MKRGITVLALWALPVLSTGRVAAQGGVVFGTVGDSAGVPLSGARVVVRGTVLSVFTNNGQYRLTGVPAGSVTLDVRLIGYYPGARTVDVEPGAEVRADFALAATPIRLDDVVVTPGGVAQLASEAVTSVAVVDSADITRRAVNTIEEVVGVAPGAQMIDGQINLRGSSGYVRGLGNRVLVLVDGVPVNQGDRGGVNWDLLPVIEIERIEIVKGGGSAVYGSAALGGVAHLFTHRITQGWHGRIRTTVGALGDPPHEIWRFRDKTGLLSGVQGAVSYGMAKVGGRVAAAARHSDGYREQDARDHWQVAGRGEWHPTGRTSLRVAGAWAHDDYDVPLFWCTSGRCDDRGQRYQPFKVDTSELGARTVSRKGYLAARLERTPSSSVRLQARASWIRTHFTDYRDRVEFSVANRFGGELRAEIRPSDGRVVTIGTEVARSDSWSNIFSGDTGAAARSQAQGEYAAYGGAVQQVGKVRFTAGARLDLLDSPSGALSAVLSPRGGVVIPTGGGIWRASAARGFRAPSLAERFVSTSVLGLRVIPNPTLDPETGWSFELGHRLGRDSVGPSVLRTDVALFWSEFENLIEPTVDLARGTIQLRNVSRARLAGLDVTVLATPFTPRLSTSLSYVFLYARALASDTIPEKPLAFRPRHLLTLTADYRLGVMTVGGDLRLMSRFENVELFQDFDVYPTDRRLPMRLLDLRAGVALRSLTAQLQVDNALNYVYNLVPRTLEPVRTATLTLMWAH